MKHGKIYHGYEGRYQASTLGRIKRVGCYSNYKYLGETRRKYLPERIMKPVKMKKYPYMQVTLCDNNCIQKVHRLHKLIMLTFIGKKEKGLEIRHLNGNGYDNRLENLKYDTHSKNMLDKYKHHGVYTKLTKKQIKEIAIAVINHGTFEFAFQKQLAADYGVNDRTIRAIRDRLLGKGDRYKWLPKELYQ